MELGPVARVASASRWRLWNADDTQREQARYRRRANSVAEGQRQIICDQVCRGEDDDEACDMMPRGGRFGGRVFGAATAKLVYLCCSRLNGAPGGVARSGSN